MSIWETIIVLLVLGFLWQFLNVKIKHAEDEKKAMYALARYGMRAIILLTGAYAVYHLYLIISSPEPINKEDTFLMITYMLLIAIVIMRISYFLTFEVFFAKPKDKKPLGQQALLV